MAARVTRYSTTLPAGRTPGSRVASVASAAFHLLLLALLVLQSLHRRATPDRSAPAVSERPVQLFFAPPRPTPTPRPPAPAMPEIPAPLTPGPDQTPGTTAQVSPTPEPEPNAPPDTPRQSATRPDPGDETADRSGSASTTQPGAADAASASPLGTIPSTAEATASRPTLESEARRLFGRPSSKLGPTSGSRENRPWETPVERSRGCTLPPADSADSTVPAGMAAVQGRIYRQDTGGPLAGARLQILGTPYGAFSDSRGQYRLVFDRSLVDACRTQSVRITAPGYEGRDVLLYVGNQPNSDVPLRRY
jgi:hypothetical protein